MNGSNWAQLRTPGLRFCVFRVFIFSSTHARLPTCHASWFRLTVVSCHKQEQIWRKVGTHKATNRAGRHWAPAFETSASASAALHAFAVEHWVLKHSLCALAFKTSRYPWSLRKTWVSCASGRKRVMLRWGFWVLCRWLVAWSRDPEKYALQGFSPICGSTFWQLLLLSGMRRSSSLFV